MGARAYTAAEVTWMRESLERFPRNTTLQAACQELARKLGRPINSTNITRLFVTKGLAMPSDYIGKAMRGVELSPPPVPDVELPTEPEFDEPEPVRASTAPPVSSPKEPDGFALFRALKGKGINFEDLCDRLNLSPRRARELIESAQASGMLVQVEHGRVGLAQPEPSYTPQDTGIPPVVGKKQVVGVISDTHLGSKYCLREHLVDFVHWAYHERGVREILHPGDVVDGHYNRNGQLFETSHLGLDAQCEDLYDTLPQLPGLTYHGITGNHDETFWSETGHDTGLAIERFFTHPPGGRKPRHDFKFYGNRGAHITIRGIRVHLWHPRSGKSYARTYHLQKLATLYTGGEKPHLTLAGHWHVSAYCVERGIHMIACPTFQGGGSAFGRSLGGAPEIGGLVLGWELTEHGTIRNFSYERRAYFEVEAPHSPGLGAGVHVGYGE